MRPALSGATVAQLICGNAERVKDVVMASSDEHDDEVEADLGHSMKLPGNGGTTDNVMPTRGGTANLPGTGGTPNLPGGMRHSFAKWRRR